ncbi:MAG: cupin domain-containing protein [Firmicutes bacterium]|nr:cupin domain-containing protein [Gammaproteobacteria bacterium]MCL5051078.1 cupin domain-containing protein [Bacillota bacterium]
MTNLDYVLNHFAFNSVEFLRDYWQQKPCVIRQGFIDFQDPISPEELAGLALEPGVDSRVVSQRADSENPQNAPVWDLQHGPIEDFSQFGDEGWSLLVQAVNEHYPPAQELLRAFRFLPDWRVDDLMVSYSTANGGVGAHLDQYDVFIVQGMGKRLWQVGPRADYEEVCPHPELKQIRGFVANLEAELEPGDILYIPAGFPHAGFSLEPALNYSVGLRAPSQAELLSAVADEALDQNKLQERFRDRVSDILNPEQTELNGDDPWFISDAVIDNFKKLMIDAFNDDQQIKRAIVNLLSRNPRPPLPEWPQQPYSESALSYSLERYDILLKAVGVRMVSTLLDGKHYAIVQNNWYEIEDEDAEALFVLLLEMTDFIALNDIKPYLDSSQARQLLVGLLNEGLFLLDHDTDDSAS